MFIKKLSYFLAIVLSIFYSSVAIAEHVAINPIVTELDSSSMLEGFIGNYMGVEQLGSYLISLFVAIALAVIIAYHPQTYGRRENLNDIEAPKTLIFYAMIGSLVGATVADYGPQLGFIFFGLGGLMRFRTNSGTSIQTGRLILVALIGLCCGLKMLYLASLSTVVAWILIYLLERKTIYQVEIKKLDDKVFLESVAAYHKALKKQKCNIIIENKNIAKSKVSFIFSSPAKLNRENIEAFLEEYVTYNYRGVIDWTMN